MLSLACFGMLPSMTLVLGYYCEEVAGTLKKIGKIDLPYNIFIAELQKHCVVSWNLKFLIIELARM